MNRNAILGMTAPSYPCFVITDGKDYLATECMNPIWIKKLKDDWLELHKK